VKVTPDGIGEAGIVGALAQEEANKQSAITPSRAGR
jgi:hypothetical protein